jgi:hypothetical protein
MQPATSVAGFSFSAHPAWVERVSKEVPHDYEDPASPPRLCQNCAAPLRGPYCTKCGQHDVDYHRSFYHLTHDLLENLFHFEGKFFTSVAWLLAKPGRLTAEFNAGRRQSQLNPLRFYIFVTVLFFLGVHLLNNGHIFDFDRKKVDRAASNLQATVKDAGALTKDLTPAQKEEFGRLLGEAIEANPTRFDPKLIPELVERVKREAPATDSPDAAKPKKKKPNATIDVGSEAGRELKRKLASGEITISKVVDEIESRVPTLLFLGMPICALLLKLLYRRSRRYYIEHLIFSVHLHTWAFLVFMVGIGYFKLAALGPRWLTTAFGWLLTGWMIWYVFAAFRTVYQQGWIKTGMKLMLLASSYLFAILMLTWMIAALTVAWLLIR